MQRRWFTIPELLVSILLGMIIVGGAMYFYSYVAENFMTVRKIGFDYQSNESFASKYRELRNKYTKLAASAGSVPFGGTGFQAVIFTNSWGTDGFLLWVFDQGGQKVSTGSNLETYSKYSPFYQFLSGATLSSAVSSPTSYVNGLNSDIANAQKSFFVFDNVAILRLKYSRINGSESVGKLDYLLANYDDSLFGTKLDLSSAYDISIIR